MSNDEIIMVSTDSHGSAPPMVFREYIEARYLPDLDALNQENDEFRRMAAPLADFPPEVLDVIDDQDAIRSGGLDGACDLDRRLVELDREGIVAELVIPGSQYAVEPFFLGTTTVRTRQSCGRLVGARITAGWRTRSLGPVGG